MIKNLAEKNRSYRRFFQDKEISKETLLDLLELTRFCGSAANKQPLKYILSNTKDRNGLVFASLTWAGYLSDWPGPEEGEKPSAYIIILLDRTISENPWVDHGIAAQTMLLGAVEKGLGGCIFGAINKERLRNNFSIPEHLDILLVLALGWPKEQVVLEDVPSSGNIKYYRDEKAVHHVPKRKLEEILLNL